MLRRYNFRPINIKIIKVRRGIIDVYNTHNENMRQFTSLQRMFSYHSPNTVFIDYNTSREIERNPHRLQTTDKIIIYQHRGVYRLINETQVENPTTTETTYHIMGSYNVQHIIGIQRRTGTSGLSNAAQTSTPTEEQINTNLIYPYHYGPRDLNMRNHPDDVSDEKRYFGIELEMDASRDSNASATKKHTLATRLNRLLNQGNYNSLVKFEVDGSIGQQGIEMITQPMTMKFIMNNKTKFKEAMQMIDELNYSSHDSGRCGMHIHVSRNALTPESIDNLYLMFENFKNEIVAFSRRTESGMNWCRFITDRDGYISCPETIDDEYIKQNKPSGNNHHSAINNGNNNTVEFRIFRGTTKIRTFIANIQLIDNMITIAKRQDITGIKWDDIINLNDEYTELKEYNEKRAIVSKHELTKTISKLEVTQRPVILVRPFQMRLEGDN